MINIQRDITDVRARIDNLKIPSVEDITDIKTRLDGIKIPSVENIQRDIDTLKKINPLVDRFFEESPLSTMKRLVDISGNIDAMQNFNRNTNESFNKNLNELKASIAIVDKFFGAVKLSDVAMLYSEIIERLSELVEIKKSIDKVKILHLIADISNVVYFVAHGTFDWVQGVSNRVNFTPTVAGIYRFTTASNKQFNIIASGVIGIPQSWATVVNTVAARVDANIVWTFTIVSSTDATVLRSSIPWVIEFISDMPIEK